MSLARNAQRIAERRRRAQPFPSRVLVLRGDGDPATDPRSGRPVKTWREVSSDVPARLASRGQVTVTIGDVEYASATGELALEATYADLADDDVVEITAGEWTGSFLRVVAALHGDLQVARRVPVAETTDPR